MPLLAHRTLLWKYAAYFAGLVSLLLVASGAISGYFAYQESLAALEAVQKATANYAAREIEIFMRGAERAILATRKLLNSQVVQNTRSPFSNPRAETSKLCGHSRLTSAQIYSIGKFHSLLILR